MHGMVDSTVFPLVYCLCSRKTEETYTVIFSHLRTHAACLGLRLAPSRVSVDFERASINAIQSVFLDAEVHCCLFHWGQAAWRKVAELGLISLMRDDNEIKMSISTLFGLPFLPVEDLEQIFVELRGVTAHAVLPFWKHLDENYVRGKPRRGRRQAIPPLFPPNVWNVYNSVLNGWARTNNYVESWHSKFGKLLNTKHPNIWRFLEQLKKEEKQVTQSIIQLRGGQRRLRYPGQQRYSIAIRYSKLKL